MADKISRGDVIVIGGGPAGLSAVLWCAELDLRPILIEKAAEPGGQMLSIYHAINNYPGVTAENGGQLRDRFLQSLSRVEYRSEYNAETVDLDTAAKSITLADGRRIYADAIIIATGVRRRTLGVEGEERYIGKGILESGARDAKLAAGKRVAVIGGGDAAVENALLLAEHAERVFLVHRREKLSARAEFADAALANPRIEFRPKTIVKSFNGENSLESLNLGHLQPKSAEKLNIDLAILRIGVTPNTEILRDKIDLDANGYITVNAICETSVLGLFAIGNVAHPTAPTISNASGTAATAAKAIFALLKYRR